MILGKLVESGCTEDELRLWSSYFEDRWACMESVNGNVVWKRVERGCPQGSIGGPTLWNLCMNELLWSLEERGWKFAAFADDLTLVVEARTRAELMVNVRQSMSGVYEWGKKYGVEVSDQKTVMVQLKGSLDFGRDPMVRVQVEEQVRRIRVVDEMKLLGICMGEGMNVRPHIMSLREKVTNVVGKMKRVLRKDWRVKRKVWKVWIKGLFEAIVMYGPKCLGKINGTSMRERS
uniref:Reverse transcriptase domain-containing protein n=1 Tax=Trichogramma kaykai TaxID=54128 RepID=A0ABD2X7S4_9HYME